MHTYLKWFSRIVWIGIALNLSFALPALFSPDVIVNTIGVDPNFSTVWLRNAGLLLLIVCFFNVVAALDPDRHSAVAWIVVAGRLMAGTFFLEIFIFDGLNSADRPNALVPFFAVDLTFGTVKGVLLYRGLPQDKRISFENISRIPRQLKMQPKWIGLAVGVVFGGLALAAGSYVLASIQRDEPEQHVGFEEHFKYGSIGSDRLGIPYWIWMVLPTVFPDHLPEGPSEGYARFGFIYERSSPKSRPIGVSYREKNIPQIGLNCAVCHTGTLRDYPEDPGRFVLGMPANQFNLQGYLRFLFAVANDDSFNADTLIPAIGEINPRFSWIDRLVYRFLVIPRTRDGLLGQIKDFAWMDSRPDHGPGRVDTFTLFKELSDLGDNTVGTVDLPSIWSQDIRRGMWLHWDGNNNSVDERNINAAIGTGGVTNMEEAIDLEGINRIADWIATLTPPKFPETKINRQRAEAGSTVYQTNCAVCHSLDGAQVGQVTRIQEVGTDRDRLDSFTEDLANLFNSTVGAGRPWDFTHFRKTDGYANMPLDGIWLRAPYLHNGSVPTLRDLLKPSEERPKEFYRGYDVYDFDDVGFISAGPEAERLGFKYDTTAKGNGNQGHEYGTNLNQKEIDDLVEFLKTQ